LSYRYRPSSLNQPSSLHADTLYVVGGLYGNSQALEHILDLKKQEDKRYRKKVKLLFNGDFNWFNVDDTSFQYINETVLKHRAIRGNVEEEMIRIKGDDCGCTYPSYVGDDTVERSSQIIKRLKDRASRHFHLTEGVRVLPKVMIAQLGEVRVCILHGDPECISGWGFSVEAMEPFDENLRKQLNVPSTICTTQQQVLKWFEEANVDAFACTHTCLPFAQDFKKANGDSCVVFNNGSAGMANFKGTTYGLLTRISTRPEVPENSIYGISIKSVRFDAIPIKYNFTTFSNKFLENWNPSSAAHVSYFERLSNGPNYTIAQAARGNVELLKPNTYYSSGAQQGKSW